MTARDRAADPLAPFIRTATADDLDELIALAQDAGHEGPQPLRPRFAADLEQPERTLFVATVRDELAGYGRAAFFEPPPGAPTIAAPRGYYLSGLLVAPSRRRMGLGRALIVARLDWAFERAPEVWYFTDAGNRGSLRLHERAGFVEVTREFTVPDVTFESGAGVLARAIRR